MVEKTKLPRAASKRKQLEQNLAHVTQEMYKQNSELATTNRTLSLLRTIDTLVLGSHESTEYLCGQLAKAITENSEYAWVSIFGKTHAHERLDLFGWYGSESHIIQKTDELVVPAYLSMS